MNKVELQCYVCEESRGEYFSIGERAEKQWIKCRKCHEMETENKKHQLILVGWNGIQRVYLDIGEEEAKARFGRLVGVAVKWIERDGYVTKFFFDEEFELYVMHRRMKRNE